MEEYWNGNETSEGVTEQRGPAIADLCEPMGGPPQLIVVYRNARGCGQVSETNMPMRWLCKGGLPSLTHASLSTAHHESMPLQSEEMLDANQWAGMWCRWCPWHDQWIEVPLVRLSR